MNMLLSLQSNGSIARAGQILDQKTTLYKKISQENDNISLFKD